MKKFIYGALALIISLSACSEQEKKADDKNTSKNTSKTASAQTGALPNYRYVDLDTVLSKYNLAKDYNEQMLRMQTNLENEAKRHESSIQSFASSVNKKMQNNGYLTEASLRQDQEKMASMQQNAQKSIAGLQSNFENAAMKAQKEVNDSIEAFIKTYNASHGYDAIFFKAATLYIDPRLDITSEVVAGLNERYNKVKK